YIWVDVTLIRPQITQGLWTGYYESEITVSTQSLTSHILLLRGKYGWPLVDPPPFYSFGVTKTIADPFPFSELEGRTTTTQALKVAEVSYISSETAATIHFAANAAGTSDPFSFHCEGSSFPYYLAFKATNPNRSVEQAAPGQTFATEIEQVWSPIDSTPSDMHVLQGDLKIYLPDNQVQPAEGVYTATVYCFVTPQ
ncbi:MAG TPA: hypothetical protein P5046_03055, partial [Sphaerochaeta sp.]|nr:hypothetical protein [Sphaerochaeta sp.]